MKEKKSIDYCAVLADLHRKRDVLARVHAVVEEMAEEQRQIVGPVCVIDISRCPTLIEQHAKEFAEEVKNRDDAAPSRKIEGV